MRRNVKIVKLNNYYKNVFSIGRQLIKSYLVDFNKNRVKSYLLFQKETIHGVKTREDIGMENEN